MENHQEVKSVKKWVIILIAPIIALVLVAILQLVLKFVFATVADGSGTGVNGFGTVINLVYVLVGMVSVMAIILTPVWLVMLVRDLKGHTRSKTVAVVLAIFFSYFAWIYTFEK